MDGRNDQNWVSKPELCREIIHQRTVSLQNLKTGREDSKKAWHGLSELEGDEEVIMHSRCLA